MSAAQGWTDYAPAQKEEGWQDYQSAAPKDKPASEPAAPAPSFGNTLGREVKSFGQNIIGIPGGVYHAFADEPTPDETKEYGGAEQVSGAKRIGLGIGRLTAQPVGTLAGKVKLIWSSPA